MTPVELPAVAAPMVSPVTVTVTALLAATLPPSIEMMIWVLLGVPALPAGGPLPLTCTPGVPVLEKNPEGYVSVMLLPLPSAPPALVVNENVAAAPDFPATRSEGAIENAALVTCPPITPELTPDDSV